MNITELLRQKKASGITTVITDVDGVHTSRDEGVLILGRPAHESMPLFTLKKGVEVLELVPRRSETTNSKDFVLAGLEGDVVMELYRFDTRDGQGIIHLLAAGIRVIVTSGRDAAPVRHRFGERLGAELHLGVRDKHSYFTDLGLVQSSTAFITDGHQDATLLQAVRDAGGVAVGVADSEPEVCAVAEALTESNGGDGAFAEFAHALLKK